jgi:3-hydroxyisobutyrate dehydrogenase
MARNLRAKIPASDNLIVHDVNEEAMRKLVDEAKAAGGNTQAVQITDSARALAEKAVRFASHLLNVLFNLLSSLTQVSD